MKKIFIISVLLIVLLLTVTSCDDKNVVGITSNITSNTTTNEILGTYNPKYYEGDAVPDEETAIALAEIYFERVVQSQGYFSDYIFGEAYITNDNNYRVWFIPKDAKHIGALIIDKSYGMVIYKEDGSVRLNSIE